MGTMREGIDGKQKIIRAESSARSLKEGKNNKKVHFFCEYKKFL
jgi:hypothetical protein